MLEAFLYDRGPVVADLSDYTDVFKSSKHIVYQETLGEVGVKGGEVVILARDTGGSCRPGVEDFSIYPLRGADAPLYHGDLSIEGVMDVGAGLGASLLVKVGDGVVVGVGDVVLCPITLEDAAGVFFFVVVTFQGVFHHCNMTKQ